MKAEILAQGVIGIIVLIIFLLIIIPELSKSTGINLPFLSVALILLIVGIIAIILKEFSR